MIIAVIGTQKNNVALWLRYSIQNILLYILFYSETRSASLDLMKSAEYCNLSNRY